MKRRYGYSEKIVIKELQEYERRGFITIKDGKIIPSG
jgi:hypothetical protein